MPINIQPQAVGTLAYPFYIADFASDGFPVPVQKVATLYVLETGKTFIYRGNHWTEYTRREEVLLPVLESIDAKLDSLVTMFAGFLELASK